MRRAAVWPVVTGLALALTSGPAALAGPAAVESASWTQLRQTSPVGVTPDLQQGQGDGLPVDNGVAGPVAYSAVRFAADGAVQSLSLALLSGGTTSTPVVWACPVTGGWRAGPRQAWDTRPSYDCRTHAVGRVAGTQVSWQLPGDAAVDLVLVPADGDSSPWSVTFAVPTARSFGTTTAGSPVPPAGAVPAQAGAGAAVAPVGPVGVTSLPGQPAGVAAPVTAPGPGPQVQAGPPGRAVLSGTAVADHAWAGRALLALVALLLMVRMAAPSPSLGGPTSLLRRVPTT